MVFLVLADPLVDRRLPAASARWMNSTPFLEPATIIAAPILDGKDHAEPSAVAPDSLLRESRHRGPSSRLLP
jgi:hypothetical protein